VTASTPSAAGSGVRKTPVTVGRALSLDKSRARRALTEGLVHDAYAALRPLVAAGRNDAEFLGLLALAALRVGLDDEALVIYRRLSGLEPDSGRWRTGLALAQERLGLDATDLYVEALARSEPAGALQHALLTRLEGAS
jgi:Flp pilus assembly protein TadD